MAVLKMQKIYICAPKSNRKEILEDIQRQGIVQIEDGGQEDQVFLKTDTASQRGCFEKQSQQAEQALKILDDYAPEKKGVLASLEGKTELSAAEYYNKVKNQEPIFEEASRLIQLQKQVGEEKGTQARLQVTRDSLQPWMGLDIPLNTQGTGKAAVIIGALPGMWDGETVSGLLAEELPELQEVEYEIISSSFDQTCMVFFCSAEKAHELEDGLRKRGFTRPVVQSSLTPKAYDEKLAQEYRESQAREEKIRTEIAEKGKYRKDFQFISDYYSLRAEKYGVIGRLLQSEHVFFISGYVTEKKAGKLKKYLEDTYLCEVDLEDVPEDEEAPVLLQNNSFSAATEDVVDSFGLPHKGEIDPTTIMSFFYYFLFGLMLSDAGYGLVMTIGCFIVLKKFRHMEQGTKRMLTMFFYCGISTTIWGILFGGFFGDLIPVIGRTFFHTDVVIPAVWFAPLEDPMKLLLYSFLFGIIHLFTGLALKAYTLIKNGQYMDALCSVGFWYMLLIGLLMMLLPSDIFASMAGSAPVFPGWAVMLSKVLAIGGALGLILMTARDQKNIGLRIALGAYELYGVTSWLSDILSYSRLLALGLATGVIASVINTMAEMVGAAGIIGKIFFIIIVAGGHVLNLAINLLGAYVHTNRLQYVEFFGKFYEGGGKAFAPFSAASTKYINIKEER